MQELWAAVLTQAVLDAVGRSGFVRKDYTTRGVLHSPHTDAREWFEANGEDFRMVATLAGFDPDCVRDAVLNTPDQIGPLHLAGPETRKRRPARTEGRAA